MEGKPPEPQLGLWSRPPRKRSSGGSAAKIYTVTELVQLAGSTLEQRLPLVWVEGELSNLKATSSGHLYFSLKDKDSQISAVMFRSSARQLKKPPVDGRRMRCYGRVTIYPPQGRFQIIVDRMEPAGLGELLLALEQLKEKLAREGLFDTEKKRKLPPFPSVVGVVTSPTGAAVKDIIDVLGRRWPARVVISPASVQGDFAPAEIVQAIRLIQRFDEIDLLICGRGGGSAEDLWAFNNEAVVRAIAGCRVPVISAVGHEVDFTLADLAADVRAPTPSAAAELAVPDRREVARRLASIQVGLKRHVAHRIQQERNRLAHLRLALPDPARRLTILSQDLDHLNLRLADAMRSALLGLERARTALDERLKAAHPHAQLARKRKQLEELRLRLIKAAAAPLSRARQLLASRSGRLLGLDPLKVLERGYSLTLDESGKAVRSHDQVQVGHDVRVLLHRGHLTCRVEQSHPAHPSRDPSRDPSHDPTRHDPSQDPTRHEGSSKS